ncbi:hypothetical protein K6M47_10420 [Enterobacter hormaechei]|uniref:hypothetical protein n=1 Tax=Enterobacteriaceae TaxID=543 RepID=UPI000D6F8815|nr:MULTISPECIES: hypothetical protein [Enterobacteriaceae]MBY4620648.1 hypothetical protein [Enterobacter hormaechei]MCR3711480.1 hypothetical protein [Citrobacter freundii]MDM3159143.1 hypothetical protein [Citrobacter sp. Cf118]MDV1745398.1 hypothetical protein [Citrobacter freundii]MEB0443177.1 hypothetical protein [Citrobacter freundii]
MTNTYSTIQTKIISFEENWHLPTLSLVNQAHRSGTPSALLEAVKHTDQAITALEHLQTSVALLVQRDGSTITPQEAWRIANDLEELACSFQYITLELGELAIEIAEECAVCEGE